MPTGTSNNTIDALFSETRQTDELTALGLAEWDCLFCEKPQVVGGADDMILHIKMDHPKKMRNFCTSHGLDYNEVLIRLGERPEKKEAITSKVEAPAPAPKPEVKVDAPVQKAVKSSAKPCVCGYVGTDGKDAGAHKRTCVIWKAEMGKAPTGEIKRTDEELFEIFTQAINALSGLKSEAGKDVEVYESLEAKRARLQRWEEVKPSILPYVKLGYGEKEFEICEQVFKELKVRLEVQTATSEAYQRGQKAHNLLLETRIKDREASVRACSDANAEYQEEAHKKANNWIDEQSSRFERLFKGNLRVQGATSSLSFLTQVNWEVSKKVGELAKAKSYNLRQDEETICFQKAVDGLEAAGFPQSKVIEYRGTRKDVNDDGIVVETKNAVFEATAVLPIVSWAQKITQVLMYVRKVYRQSDHKVGTDAAMMTDEFKQLFGWTLQPQDPGSDVQGWRLSTGKAAKATPKYDEGDTAMSKAIKDAGGAEVILRSKANGEPNQRQPKAGKNKRKQQSKNALSPERIMQIRSDDAKRK
jgi:hypothetical protein